MIAAQRRRAALVVLILTMATGAEAGLFGGGTKQASMGGLKTSTGQSGGGPGVHLSFSAGE
jgi:hypothetical protein